MHTETHTGLDSPRGNWWRPAHKAEKVWVGIAFAWCMVLFAMMPLWHWKGGQNPSGIRRRVEPTAFFARTEEFIKQNARVATKHAAAKKSRDALKRWSRNERRRSKRS